MLIILLSFHKQQPSIDLDLDYKRPKQARFVRERKRMTHDP
jgi:hypothetical protein